MENDMDWINKAAPTHRCKVCGALWRFWRKEDTHFSSMDSWSLVSIACGKCCDMETMGEQIEYLTIGEMEKYIIACHAVDAMTQHILGPKENDRVN